MTIGFAKVLMEVGVSLVVVAGWPQRLEIVVYRVVGRQGADYLFERSHR
jgi:hypothetical protein